MMVPLLGSSSISFACLLLFNAIRAESVYDTYCVVGSHISTFVDGSYTYKYTNDLGAVYHNEEKEQYLFPWESGSYKQYIISDNPNVSIPNSFIADSFSTIQTDSPYTFNVADFAQNWQSFTSQNLLIKDTEMRLTACQPICVESGSYQGAYIWKEYDLSTEASIYYNALNGLYLYRSNISANSQNWQIFNGLNFLPITQRSGNISSCDGLLYLSTIGSNKQHVTHTNTEALEIDSNSIKITAEYNENSKGNLLWIIPASIAIVVMIVAVVTVTRAYLFEQRNLEKSKEENAEEKEKDPMRESQSKSSTNELPRKTSRSRKESEVSKGDKNVSRKSSRQSRSRRSTGNGHSYRLSNQLALDQNIDFSRKMSMQSVGSLSPQTPTRLSALSPSHRKYSDIMPPTRPPPLGMKKVLSADQQAKRPLPATPKSSEYVD